MENTPNSTKLAILIDAENVVASHADLMFAQAEAMGEIACKEIYGTAAALTTWVEPVLKYAIHPNLTIRAAKGKNSSDIALVIGAMDLLLAGGMDTIVIASSDSDFSALSVRLRNAGINVVGMGTEKSNALWRTACTSFIVLDHPAPAPKPQPQARPEPTPEVVPAAPTQPDPQPETARKSVSTRRQSRAGAPTHRERVSIIEQFIEKRLDSSGGHLQVGTLFTGLNKLPEYRIDRQGSGRKPLNYLSSTYGEHFQFVNSTDGKTWVSRVGDDPLPPGAEPLREGDAPIQDVTDAPAEPEEVIVEETAPEIDGETAVIEPESDIGAEAEPEAEAPLTLSERLVNGGMDPEVAEKLAPVFESSRNLFGAYNVIRKLFGDVDGRAYYHQAKAIFDAET